MAYSEELKHKVWQKGEIDDRYNPVLFRKDACGAWMFSPNEDMKNYFIYG